jgi:CMP-N,N'-diacetyllegionaminic acid synthase
MPDSLIAVIPARGGSRRLPNKNCALIGQESLVERAVRTAIEADRFDRVFVDTDSVELGRLGQNAGAELLYIRPTHLATEQVKTADVLVFLLDYLVSTEGFTPDGIAVLQPTSPLRSVSDIHAAVDRWMESPALPLATVTKPVQEPRDLLVQGPDGRLQPAISATASGDIYFEDGSVYVTPVQYLRSSGNVFHPAHGAVVEIDPLHGIDVDEQYQLDLARALALLFQLRSRE